LARADKLLPLPLLEPQPLKPRLQSPELMLQLPKLLLLQALALLLLALLLKWALLLRLHSRQA